MKILIKQFKDEIEETFQKIQENFFKSLVNRKTNKLKKNRKKKMEGRNYQRNN